MPEKPQILIVEDEVDMCWVLKNILMLTDLKTHFATSGKDGIKLLERFHQKIKLIFLDIKLPDIDGRKIASLIRKHYPEIKIIIITGFYYHDTEVIQQGLNNGLFDWFISKPFNISEIRAVIEKVLPSVISQNFAVS